VAQQWRCGVNRKKEINLDGGIWSKTIHKQGYGPRRCWEINPNKREKT
jgi:hypothetical protein